MTQKKLSQTEQYGELLTSSQQYRLEIRNLPDIDTEQEALLVERARSGDTKAKHQLIEHALHYVEHWAYRYYSSTRWESPRIEYQELVGVGNLVLVEKLELALTKESPIGYLKRSARLAMSQYYYHNKTLIETPHNGEEDVCMSSLDVPMYSGNEVTVGECIEDPVKEECKEEEDFRALYLAIGSLTAKQQYAILHVFGLGENAAESMSVIGGGKVTKQTIFLTKNDALAKLRVLMPTPQTCCEVYTVQQACERLGVKRSKFTTLASLKGVKSIIPKTGLYAKEDIEEIRQEQAAIVSIGSKKRVAISA